jgi:hypothetical protein
MYAHPSFSRGHTEILSELKKCKSAAARKRQAKSPHQQNPQSSTAMTMQEILPATLGAHINSSSTRAVSPSSSLDDDTYANNMRNISHAAHHFYGQPPHFSAGTMHSSHAYPQLMSHQIREQPSPAKQPAPAQPTRKLDLLTLAITCLDSASKSQA